VETLTCLGFGLAFWGTSKKGRPLSLDDAKDLALPVLPCCACSITVRATRFVPILLRLLRERFYFESTAHARRCREPICRHFEDLRGRKEVERLQLQVRPRRTLDATAGFRQAMAKLKLRSAGFFGGGCFFGHGVRGSARFSVATQPRTEVTDWSYGPCVE
jgi:hypothetical protein